MADRTVSVRFTADVNGAVAGLAKLGASATATASKIEGKVGPALDKLGKHTKTINHVGTAMMAFGAVAGAALVGAGKAAMDWESAWTGVTKTVDGSASQLAELQDQLREMARTMPESHEQIAAVAEAAGQLGVATPDIAKFTKVMVELGDTTNLTSDEAATSLAQFMNIMGTAGDQVDRLGATIVGLGNNGASTERDIVQMGQRIAGAGKQVGLSEQQVLGYANALASVGVEAEAGGTAISQSFLKIEQITRKGGSQLDLLAKTAGMTGKQFQQAFEDDAGTAMDAFIKGLGRMQQSGGDVTGTLEKLGITGMRQTDALRRLAGAGDLLSDSLDQANKSWTDNTALAEEAAKRYGTTESKIKIAMNGIRDNMIDVGAVMLPIIASISETVSKIADAFGGLPDPVKKGVGVLLGISAAAGLVGGGLLKAFAAFLKFRTVLQSANITMGLSEAKMGKLAGAGKKLGKGLGIAAAIAAAVAGLNALTGGLRDTTTALDDLNGAVLDSSGKRGFGNLDKQFRDATESGAVIKDRVDGVADAIGRLGNESAFDKFGEWVDGLGLATSSAAKARDQFKQLDSSLTSLSQSGAADQAAATFAKLAQSARDQNVPLKNLIDLFPQYAAQARQAAESAGVTVTSSEQLADIMSGKLPPAMQKTATSATQAGDAVKKAGEKSFDAAKELEKVVTAADDAANALLGLSNTSIDYEEAIDNATKSLKENGKTLDIHTEKGRNNQRALNAIAQAAIEHRDAMIKDGASTEDVRKETDKATKALSTAAQKFGMGKKKADDYAKGLLGVDTQSVTTKGEIDKLNKAYDGLPATKHTKVAAPGARPSKKDVDKLMTSIKDLPKDTQANIRTIADLAGVRAAQNAIDSIRGRTVTVYTNYVNRVSGPKLSGPKMSAYAGGGQIRGQYLGPKADNMIIRANPREYVQQVSAVDYYGVGFMDAINQRRIPKSLLRQVIPGLADGGQPQRFYAPTPVSRPVSTPATVAAPMLPAQQNTFVGYDTPSKIVGALRRDRMALALQYGLGVRR